MTTGSYNEYKYLVTNENLLYVKMLLDAFHGESDPYPSGIVDSIYYDDLFSSCYTASCEGDAIKKKFRLRSYDHGSFNSFCIKSKELYTVTKSKLNIPPIVSHEWPLPTLSQLVQTMKNDEHIGVLAALMGKGEMYPVLRVRYRRYRYRINDQRVTLDTNIEIMALTSREGQITDYALLPDHVLEIKTPGQNPHIHLFGLISLPMTPFSKFYLGLEHMSKEMIA